LAGALSVAGTMVVLQLIRMPHPPAGATTLIISLGVIATPIGVASMAAALVFTILAGFGIVWLLWNPEKPWSRKEQDSQ